MTADPITTPAADAEPSSFVQHHAPDGSWQCQSLETGRVVETKRDGPFRGIPVYSRPAQPAPDATPAQPVSAAGSDGLWKASAQSGFAALRMVREAVEAFGPATSLESPEAVLLRGPEPTDEAEAIIEALGRLRLATLAQPVSAGSEPVAWRYRNIGWPNWRYREVGPVGGYDTVEPLYATPTPALAPQDGGLRAAAQRRVTHTMIRAAREEFWRNDDLEQALFAAEMAREPDVLPGLKRARDVAAQHEAECTRGIGETRDNSTAQNNYSGGAYQAMRIRQEIEAEIARIEKERQ